ncbi:MAG TPA: HAD family phosphatase [Polyangiaceae bacterium]|nr:HAD family phosphatase [Polyangiaceae bacterium]
MFPATFFDFNGVLVNDEVVHFETFREVLAGLGVALSEHDYLHRYLGFDDPGAFRAILEDAGQKPSSEQIAALIEAKRPLYMARARASLPTFDGAAELVKRRAAAGPALVVSGALRDEIELGLEVLGVRAQIQAIVASEDTQACKPDPEGYFLGIKWLAERGQEAAARRAIVIEDSLAGVKAAKAASLPCVGITHTYTEQELRDSGCDAVVTSLSQIDEAMLTALYRRLYG